jgi:HPt (histidine-containing phosphotransfer) domain-containing protein
LDDRDLMREVLEALLDDTSQQLGRLATAIREVDAAKCARVAHYCKGACANVGAQRVAAVLQQLERQASTGDIAGCQASLGGLSREMELLRVEAALALSG